MSLQHTEILFVLGEYSNFKCNFNILKLSANPQGGEDEGSARETENSSAEESDDEATNNSDESGNEANDESAEQSYASEPRNAVSLARDPNLSQSEAEETDDDEGSENETKGADDKGPTSLLPLARPSFLSPSSNHPEFQGN